MSKGQIQLDCLGICDGESLNVFWLILLLLYSADFFKKSLSGTLSECQTVLILIRTDVLHLDLSPNCLQSISAEDQIKRVKGKCISKK